MVEIELDGQKVEVPPGSMVMHAAEKAGTYIPHFCYHKKLSIAATFFVTGRKPSFLMNALTWSGE